MRSINNLLDGVKEVPIRHTEEVMQLSAKVKDESLSLVDRVESFEDIFNLEVGDMICDIQKERK